MHIIDDMKQATPNIRTIDHADHTDIERLFYVYSPDENGEFTTKPVWAVVWCGQKKENAMTKLKDVRECDVNGTQVIICDVLETGAVLPHSILLDEYLNPKWEQDADSVFGFLKAAEATEIKDERDTFTVRKLEVPQFLRSYASYNNTGKGQPLPAEAVDGELLGE